MVEFHSTCRADEKIVNTSLTVGRRGAFCPSVAGRHGASEPFDEIDEGGYGCLKLRQAQSWPRVRELHEPEERKRIIS